MNETNNTGVLSTARRSFGVVVIACSLMVAAATVGGFLGTASWALNVLSHFRIQYFICLSVAVAALLLLRMRWSALVFGLFAAVNLVLILPLFVGKQQMPDSGRAVRSMLINVNLWNSQYDLVKQSIRDANPDVVVLEEVSSEWMRQLAEIVEIYPHREIRPREDCFGIAMLSKYPFKKSGIEYLGTAGVPSVFAEVDVDGKSVLVLGTHPLPPSGPDHARLRNEQLAAISAFLQDVKLPVILLGDLNATPWCPYFRKLLSNTGLKDTGRGYGVQPTWPSHNPLLRIPIDHCLVSQGIVVTHREVGPYTGSDHYPLIVDVAL
jgi:endonuclease/exonuclease/phosphatase (EEP) superfamily protein YafD